MRKSLIFIVLLSLISVAARAQMADKEVVRYVKSAMQSGKSNQQIGKELLARGVTVEQLQRIQDEQSRDTNSSKTSSSTISTRATEIVNRHSKLESATDIRNGMLPDDELIEMEQMKEDTAFVDVDDNPDSLIVSSNKNLPPIFGHDIFKGARNTFEPNENLATPENYKLGPGDEVIIDIWGMNEISLRETISPEGRIMISQVGPVYLNGLTIKQAQELIRKAASSLFSGIDGEEHASDISVTLGQIRTIQVNVLGEVSKPGSYRLSPFSTVFNAIYRAKGVSDIGTLRDVKVYRDGKLFASVDLYKYIFTGNTDDDIVLREGDVLIVSPYVSLVNVIGDVKRPMRYEMSTTETLSDLFRYAGGFAGTAFTDNVNVVRSNGREKEMFSISSGDFSSFALRDGDEVTIGSTLDRFSNMVQISGEVFRPGPYQLGNDVATVRQLIRQAGGLTEEAFYGRAVVLREKEDMSLETIAINLGEIMKGNASDVRLKKNDAVVIYNIHDINEVGVITVVGEVNFPDEYTFSENTTVEDAVLMAGGLKPGASTARVDVSRRIINPESLTKTDKLAEVFSFSIADGLVVSGDPKFTLEPYDIVAVRTSPEYKPQQTVTLTGEVMFEGEYVIQAANERLTDVIKRAGGITQYAYLPGARLIRIMHQEDNLLVKSEMDLLDQESTDSLNISKSDIISEYRVGIELDKAFENPHSDYDVILRDGDRIFIPELVNTVRIIGDVMYANTVTYVEGKTVRYYINQAGGFGQRARRNKAYIVYANGTVAKARSAAKLKPGSSIIVPSKPERDKLAPGDFISIGTASASLTTMLMALINLLK